MEYNISISFEAEEDILSAFLWYEEQRPGLGDEFVTVIEKSLSAIQANPVYYGFRKKNIRGCIIKRFPYKLLFVINGMEIEVISVFHMHRKPI